MPYEPRIADVRPCLVPALDELRGALGAVMECVGGRDDDEARRWAATIEAAQALLGALLIPEPERQRQVAASLEVAQIVAAWHGAQR